MKTLLLLRHSIPERTGSDPGLSADGIQLAEQVFQTEPFRRVTAVWSSPASCGASRFRERCFLTENFPLRAALWCAKVLLLSNPAPFFRDFYKNVLTTF